MGDADEIVDIESFLSVKCRVCKHAFCFPIQFTTLQSLYNALYFPLTRAQASFHASSSIREYSLLHVLLDHFSRFQPAPTRTTTKPHPPHPLQRKRPVILHLAFTNLRPTPSYSIQPNIHHHDYSSNTTSRLHNFT
jgi:hypothetical protein